MWGMGVIWAGHSRAERSRGRPELWSFDQMGSFARPSLGGFALKTPPRASVSLPSWELRGAYMSSV